MPRRAEPTPPRPQRKRAAPKPEREAHPERVVAFRLGISAESRAAAYLVAKGYRILARRWRCPLGEIDIIARRRQTLIFVEVKARERLDDAAEAVTPRQRMRIAGAAEAWLASNPAVQFADARFDAVLVAPRKMPRHIAGAFEAG
jgi:putative endonuclease